ncbi:MAG: hypothetical protein N2376_00095 [Clostridia bacterium]|nr:hypothetical protein [Clostridia bacterium]
MDNQNCGFFSIPGNQFTAAATLIGFIAASFTDSNQQNALANFLIQIGQVLATIAAQNQLLTVQQEAAQQEADEKKETEQTLKQLDELQKQLDELKSKIKR